MRQQINLLIIYLIFNCYACSTLNISEIKNIEKKEFESLQLIPNVEANNLRIDIIRQTYEENIDDSNTETKDVPYHPVGFNLGNGLFYDLNKNLSLRIDYLLNISCDSEFEINKINRPEKNKGIKKYSYKNDSLITICPPKDKKYYKYHIISYTDSTCYMHKKRLDYAIVINDTSLIYRGKKKKRDVIYKQDTNLYYVNKQRKKEKYQKKNNEIKLENDYLILQNDERKLIEIKHQGKLKNRILYNMIKDKNNLYIYNEKYKGKRIEFVDNKIKIYHNKNLITEFERIK
ncbi:MAG: hypothetical protein KAT68_11940 [Bacteroidales bacterium]|nr:hypothetical protein [Bacteroidales bacterium]